MTDPSSVLDISLKVYEEHHLLATLTISRPTDVGRRDPSAAEPAPYVWLPRPGDDRVIVADLHETSISRKHLRIEPLPDGSVALTNASGKNSVALAGGGRLEPGERRVLELPVACELGRKVLRLEVAPRDELELQTLGAATMVPGRETPELASTAFRGLVASMREGESRGDADLLLWLQASMDVFQSAAASADFLPKAARAAAQLVGLDTAAVLLRRSNEWSVATAAGRENATVSDSWQPSQTMLKRVLNDRRTFIHVPPLDGGVAMSLVGVQSLVAAPILDRHGEVIGALYGERYTSGLHSAAAAIRELDAKLFELLAYGVASGLARVEQERQLIAERVRFEQFFTPELARMLESRGDEMLAARDAEITVLFCDIKGFSRISRGSGAALAVEWVRDVLSALSDCVAEMQGVLVDYSGDSLEALWGAPLPTPQHATQACQTALKMRACLPELNERWQSRLGERTDISIGINTGRAQVGNIGSRRKFKYGAFGTTVNQASRVQGATKHVGVSLIVTRPTVASLEGDFSLRRLCAVKTVNIDEPVELFELADAPDARWPTLKAKYEEAFSRFEQGQFYEAMAIVGGLVAEFPQDEPTRHLLQRTVTALSLPAGTFDPVWNLDSK